MARRWGESLKGFTVSDLLDIPQNVISAMTRSELSQVVSRLSSAANKRLKRIGEYFERQGYDAMKVDRFGAKGKNINQLRSELSRLQNFFERKTSTVTGIKKVEREFKKRVSDRGGFTPSEFTPEQLSRFWHAYKRAEEMGLFVGVYGDSDKAQKDVFQAWAQNPNESINDFIRRFSEEVEGEYQRRNDLEDDANVSSFFRL